MRYCDLLEQGVASLTEAGIEDAEIDVRLLLEEASGLDRTALYLHIHDVAPESVILHYKKLLARRQKREPVAYIVGEREFWSLPLYVSPAVLIPRPETELLVEQALNHSRPENRSQILDLCTGSGAIAVSLAKELESSTIVACDISRDALAIARSNAKRHIPDNKVHFVQGDLLSPFCKGSFSLVISNPPYVQLSEILCELAPEVSRYEPHLALNGGDDGLDLIRRIERQLQEVLISGGELFMEFGASQGRDIVDIFTGILWENAEVIKDYAGLDRILHVRKI